MHWLDHTLTFTAAALGGVVNSVAGGGTLLTFPALILAHQTEIVANATSTVALWPGALSSFWGYRAELGSNRREIAMLAVPSFLGGILGAYLLLNTDNATFAALVPWLILLATLLFVIQEPLSRWQRRRAERAAGASQPDPSEAPHGARGGRARSIAVLLFQFLVGVYGGYFGAGIGILMLAAFGFLGLTNIHHMNALKNLNGMCINGIAAALFMIKGLVDWHLALWMASAAIIGGYAGAGIARRAGQKAVRRTIVFIGLALSVWFLVRMKVEGGRGKDAPAEAIRDSVSFRLPPSPFRLPFISSASGVVPRSRKLRSVVRLAAPRPAPWCQWGSSPRRNSDRLGSRWSESPTSQ